jgi:hypothetical protein
MLIDMCVLAAIRSKIGRNSVVNSGTRRMPLKALRSVVWIITLHLFLPKRLIDADIADMSRVKLIDTVAASPVA